MRLLSAVCCAVAPIVVCAGCSAPTKPANPVDQLINAVEQGDRKQVEQLVRSHRGLVNQQGGFWNKGDLYDWGATPLILAVRENNVGIVEVLIANGADPQAADGHGWTPLHHAAWLGSNQEIAELLIRHGADVKAATPRKVEVYEGTLRVIPTEVVARFTPLHAAAYRGNADMVRLLIAHGADVNAEADGRTPPLWLAETYGHEHAARVLREHGAVRWDERK